MSGIIVGYDGSDGSGAALSAAADLSKRLGVGLTVVFGFEANPVGGEALDYWAALREHGETVLSTAIEEAKAAGVEVDSLVVETRTRRGAGRAGRRAQRGHDRGGLARRAPDRGGAAGIHAAQAAARLADAGARGAKLAG